MDDQFGLVPALLTARPRVLCTAGDLARVKRTLAGEQVGPAWLFACVERLVENARRGAKTPIGKTTVVLDDLREMPEPANREVNLAIAAQVSRDALVHLILGDEKSLSRATRLFRILAIAYRKMPIVGLDSRAGGGGLSESRFHLLFGRAYDLLEACGNLSDLDRGIFRESLEESFVVLDRCGHRTCGNHNSWSLAARLSIALALGDRERVHGALYGCPAPPVEDSPDTPTFRYGIVHQIRHEILADGMHWERTVGYHYYSTLALVEIAMMLANSGTDLWNTNLPAAMEDDGYDLHRGYGPAGATKSLKSLFDAPLYQAFVNGDLSMLSDSGLANLRGVDVWGIIYHAAFDATHDAKYAWLIHKSDREAHARKSAAIPVALQTHAGDFDFVRLRSVSIPAGEFSLSRDATIGSSGKHVRGCSLFPQHGSAVLRTDVNDELAAGLAMFFGPHSAGHQGPAALHIDLHARGTLLTCAGSERNGYDDEEYLTWCRTTIAHNTVTVDGQPMFPYDLGANSIWEADSWRRRRSEGELESFQPEVGWSSVRASNEHVYPGVRLDRTCIARRPREQAGHGYVVDGFRCYSDEAHVYDWAMHVRGKLEFSGQTRPIDLGDGLGYRHLTSAREVILSAGATQVDLKFVDEKGVTRTKILLPRAQSVQVIVVDENASGIHAKHRDKMLLGERPGDLSRLKSGVIVRARGESVKKSGRQWAGKAEFLSLWWFDDSEMSIEATKSRDEETEEIAVKYGAFREVWELPFRQRNVRRVK